jgi:hypothetical protein
MSLRWKRYALAGGCLGTEVVAYLLWRPRMLRWGATAREATEPLPGDDRTPHPRVKARARSRSTRRPSRYGRG